MLCYTLLICINNGLLYCAYLNKLNCFEVILVFVNKPLVSVVSLGTVYFYIVQEVTLTQCECIRSCCFSIRRIRHNLILCVVVTEKYLVPNSAATLVSVAEERSLSPASYSQAPVIVQAAYTNYT